MDVSPNNTEANETSRRRSSADNQLPEVDESHMEKQEDGCDASPDSDQPPSPSHRHRESSGSSVTADRQIVLNGPFHFNNLFVTVPFDQLKEFFTVAFRDNYSQTVVTGTTSVVGSNTPGLNIPGLILQPASTSSRETESPARVLSTTGVEIKNKQSHSSASVPDSHMCVMFVRRRNKQGKMTYAYSVLSDTDTAIKKAARYKIDEYVLITCNRAGLMKDLVGSFRSDRSKFTSCEYKTEQPFQDVYDYLKKSVSDIAADCTLVHVSKNVVVELLKRYDDDGDQFVHGANVPEPSENKRKRKRKLKERSASPSPSSTTLKKKKKDINDRPASCSPSRSRSHPGGSERPTIPVAQTQPTSKKRKENLSGAGGAARTDIPHIPSYANVQRTNVEFDTEESVNAGSFATVPVRSLAEGVILETERENNTKKRRVVVNEDNKPNDELRDAGAKYAKTAQQCTGPLSYSTNTKHLPPPKPSRTIVPAVQTEPADENTHKRRHEAKEKKRRRSRSSSSSSSTSSSGSSSSNSGGDGGISSGKRSKRRRRHGSRSSSSNGSASLESDVEGNYRSDLDDSDGTSRSDYRSGNVGENES